MQVGGRMQCTGNAQRHAAHSAARTADDHRQAVGDRFTMTLSGDVDLSQRTALRELTVEFITDGSRHVTVHLSGVSFMDSSGLGFLVLVRRISRCRGGRVTLSRPRANVLRLLQTTHLDLLFEIEGC
jgi:anti-sigma B factor antagonist